MEYSTFVCKANSVILLFIGVFLTSFIYSAKGHGFTAVQMFGDSILDTGNNNALRTSFVRANFYPYGQKFIGKKATGRFGDGRIISDLIAEAVGVKPILPAYHEMPNLSPKDIQTGLCFASAGSGYDHFTSEILQVYTLQQQLKFFEDYKERLKQLAGEEKSRKIVEESLYVVSVASNDLLVSYYSTHVRRLFFNLESYTDLLISKAQTFFTDLYKAGARKIAAFGIAPLGCTPFVRTIGAGFIRRGCSDNLNNGIHLFNKKLAAMLPSLQNQLLGSRIIYIDFYNPFLQVLSNATKYGFGVVDKGCCTVGMQLETGLFCNRFTPTCKNSSDHIFWDSLHPTEAAYRAITPLIVGQFSF